MHISQTAQTGRRKRDVSQAGDHPGGQSYFSDRPFSAAAVPSKERNTRCTDVYYYK